MPGQEKEHLEPTEEHDEDEHAVIDAHGQPIQEELTMQHLSSGVDIIGETPEQAHSDEHPTPDRPSGRIVP